MEFHKRRRQQLLGERNCAMEIASCDEGIQNIAMIIDDAVAKRDLSYAQSSASMLAFLAFQRLLLKFTSGEAIVPLRTLLEEVLLAYECYGEHLWRYKEDPNEPVFDFHSIDDYCQLMQLVGLCYLLHRRDLLPRLARLQDGENRANGGADWLFEELMTYAPMERHESEQLSAAKPYEALADALSSEDNEAALSDLHRYLQRWYKDLAGTGWHDSHKPNEAGEQGGYYGYWSFEAGAAVLLLGIEDDSSLHKYLYYPKDMVAWAREHPDLNQPEGGDGMRLRCDAGQLCPRQGYWFTPAKAGSRRFFKAGDLMPDFKSDYGVTIWQWDERQ